MQTGDEFKEPLNGLFGVSCPSSSCCALTAADGQVFTNTDPLPRADRPPQAQQSAEAEEQASEDHDRQAHHPSPRQMEHHGKALVRFYANGPVRRIECKVDRHRFHPRHSPDRFQTGGNGVHGLRIRAVGTTGLHGPTAIKRYWIGRRCLPHYCLEGGGVLRPKRRR